MNIGAVLPRLCSRGGESALTSLRSCWPGAQSWVWLKRSENVCVHTDVSTCAHICLYVSCADTRAFVCM